MKIESKKNNLSWQEVKTLGHVQKKLKLATGTRVVLRERLLEWEDPVETEEASDALYYKWLTFGFLAVWADFIFRSELTLIAVVVMSVTYWLVALAGIGAAAILANEMKKPVRFLINHENLRLIVVENNNDSWPMFLFRAVSFLLISDGAWYLLVSDEHLLFFLNLMAAVAIYLSKSMFKSSRAVIRKRIVEEILSWQSAEDTE